MRQLFSPVISSANCRHHLSVPGRQAGPQSKWVTKETKEQNGTKAPRALVEANWNNWSRYISSPPLNPARLCCHRTSTAARSCTLSSASHSVLFLRLSRSRGFLCSASLGFMPTCRTITKPAVTAAPKNRERAVDYFCQKWPTRREGRNHFLVCLKHQLSTSNFWLTPWRIMCFPELEF